MSDLTPEQRKRWREEAGLGVCSDPRREFGRDYRIIDLLDALDEAEAGAADAPGPDGTIPTPQQLLRRLFDADPERRIIWAERAIVNSEKANQCFMANHAGRIGHLERQLAAAREDLAEAWDKGHSAGAMWDYTQHTDEAYSPGRNPHRAEASRQEGDQ